MLETPSTDPLPILAAPTVHVIAPHKGWLGLNVGEMWRHRELAYIFAWRDVKVRYKQTLLGFLWALLQPLTKLVIFTVIFGRLAKIDSEGAPYAVFVYAGLLPWEFFAEALQRSSQSIIEQQSLVTKASFPRMLMPVGAMGASLVDFAVSFLILLALILYYPDVHLGWRLVGVIPLVVLTIIVATGVGTFLSALNVAYRDFRYVIPFLIQVWMFLTPVIYPVSVVPPKWQWLISLNPMSGIVDAFRSVVLAKPMAWTNLGISTSVALLAFVVGVKYFRRVERSFADII